MDETTKTQQGIDTSGGAGGSTSEQETPTLTASQAQKIAEKARSDALAEVGRYKKSAETAIKSMEAVEKRLSRIEEERFNSELENARDDTDKLREIRRRQDDSRKRAEVEERERKVGVEKAEFDERIKRAEAIERRELSRTVATEYSVDSNTLEKFGGTERDAMVELAKTLSKVGTDENEQGRARMTEPPDSGKTKGGGQTFTQGEVLKSLDPSKMTPQQIKEQVAEIVRAGEEGRIK